MKRIKIFDTTLRDGEQAPGFTMNLTEKVRLAKQLEELGVDIIEAGFAIASPGDFNAIKEISRNVGDVTVASLARTTKLDIDKAWEALQFAKKPRIHIFIATSDIHLKYKLKMTREEALKQAIEAVRYAKRFFDDIEFSAEDAVRSDVNFLVQIFTAVIAEGARTINIPDTVGYTTPDEYYTLISTIKAQVPNIDGVDISVHCHNDLGFAVANSLAAINGGATQIECTINGIGERAGNAALEEIAMAIDTRKDFFNCETGIHTKQILKTSKMLQTITGVRVQPNKAIVGDNAFAHEAGIHQHGMLQDRTTYEIMTPESIGLNMSKIVLGKHSGRHAFIERVQTLGFELSKEELEHAYQAFIELCDKKKEIFDRDIEAIIAKETIQIQEIVKVKSFMIQSGNHIPATSTLSLVVGDKEIMDAAVGDGPVDASFKVIEKAVEKSIKLVEYRINAVTEGKDAQGETIVILGIDGKKYRGKGLSTDVIESSIHAYVEAVNKALTELN
ncbi:MAG: 2-isopropylmalate synthase [Clostridiales bacterium]|jgi:2-isopropylmalate synthase|nr:2-isopropylmalate synthase [Clostridiales bacterium]MDN5300429.1 2-isopropylmalate synthase [Clostridiales bacterium]